MVFDVNDFVDKKEETKVDLPKVEVVSEPVSKPSSPKVSIKMPKIDSRIYIFVGGLILGLLIMGAVGGGITGAAVSETKAKETITKYLDTALAGRGITYTIDKVVKSSSLYLIDITLSQGENKMPSQVALSKDGKYFLPSPVDLKAENAPAGGAKPREYPKTDKPILDFFVMSFCPYGQQAMNGIAPVAKLLGDKVEFNPHFVIYGPENYKGEESNYCIGDYCSMHGINELKEDVRQMCIWKNTPDKFWDYIAKVNANCKVSDIETCWKTQSEAVGLTVSDVESCATNPESMLKAEYDLGNSKKVQGSPTIFLNGEDYAEGRAPENFKTSICSAFNTAPEECSQTLSAAGSTAEGNC